MRGQALVIGAVYVVGIVGQWFPVSDADAQAFLKSIGPWDTTDGKFTCDWTRCGSTGFRIGDVDKKTKDVLVAWTKYENGPTICSYVQAAGLTSEKRCNQNYKEGCIGGYKRLWCVCSKKNPNCDLKSIALVHK
ncbi:hypothetical protein BC940DRAFT_309223 [Gongronella butleri]|nr:hypothetical protein BC940DRAFT_309223 [Gongronella butleri]